jgi:hypothetical protein
LLRRRPARRLEREKRPVSGSEPRFATQPGAGDRSLDKARQLRVRQFSIKNANFGFQRLNFVRSVSSGKLTPGSMRINALRGHLAEFGIVAAKGDAGLTGDFGG